MTRTGPVRTTGGTRPADVLARLLAGPLTSAGFELEGVDVRRAGPRHVIAVAIDHDDGVDLDRVAAASRLVSAVLDEAGELPAALSGPYTLEVTSRGVDAPLLLPRHWRRASGRLVDVRRAGGSALVGRVRAADEHGAELDVGGNRVRVEFADVTRAIVQLEFHHPQADEAGAEPDLDQHDEQEVSR